MTTRNERVVLSLSDAGFSTGMAKAATAAATLKGVLDDLDGTNVDLGDGIRRTSDDVDGLGDSTRRTSSDIDTFSGRLGILAKTAGALGPALAPLSAVAVGGVAGLANQFGFAAVAAGTAAIAFKGVGDALQAVDKAQLEPTAENLAAMRVALAGLSPAGRDFVHALDQMQPVLDGLKNTAEAGLFPGMIEGFDHLKTLAPEVNKILDQTSSTLGDLFAEGAKDLASPSWANFFDMLAAEARPTLEDMGHALGSVVHGLGQLWVAFAPLNRDFGGWMAAVAKGFDEWATGLSSTQGFQEFLDYVRTNGPRVADLVSSLGNALLQIGEAAAPLGGPVLEALTAIVDAIAKIADSPLGTPIMTAVTAMSALSLASTAAAAAVGRVNASLATLGVTSKVSLASLGTNLGAIAAIGVGLGGMFDNLGDSFSRLTDGNITWNDALSTTVHTLGPATYWFDKLWHGIDDADRTGVKGSKMLVSLTNGNLAFADSAQAATQRLIMQRNAARQAASAMVDWSNSLAPKDFSLDDWLSSIEAQIRAMRDLRINAIRAGENGVRDGLIKYLKSLGTEGAVQLERLAHANHDMVQRANRDWGSYRQEIQASGRAIDDLDHKKAKPKVDLDTHGFTGTANNAEHQLDTLDHKRATPHIVAESNAEVVSAAAAHVLGGVDRIKATPSIQVSGADAAMANARGVAGALNSIPRSVTSIITTVHKTIGGSFFADGGYTGPGGKYEPAGIVHRGEVVIPQELVQRDWSLLKSRYGHLPGFADGGMVTVGGPWWATAGQSSTGGPGWSSGGHSSTRGPGWISGGQGGGMAPILHAQFVEFERLGSALRDARGELRQMQHAVEKQRREVDKSRETVQRERQERQAVIDSMDSFAHDTLSRFTTSNLFESGSFDSIMATLSGDSQSIAALSAAEKRLLGMGLDGQALQALLSGADLSTIQQFASLTPAQLQQFEDAFNANQAAGLAAGQLGAQGAFGAELNKQTAELAIAKHQRDQQIAIQQDMKAVMHRQEDRVKSLEKNAEHMKNAIDHLAEQIGDAVTAGVNGGAKNGARSGRGR